MKDKNGKEKEKNSLECTFQNPEEEVEIVEYTIVLANIVYLGKHAIEILIYNISFRNHMAVSIL